MAKAFICDRCGRYFPDNCSKVEYSVLQTAKDKDLYVLDLCDICYGKFERFLEGEGDEDV